jgi:hypothetical protein
MPRAHEVWYSATALQWLQSDFMHFENLPLQLGSGVRIHAVWEHATAAGQLPGHAAVLSSLRTCHCSRAATRACSLIFCHCSRAAARIRTYSLVSCHFITVTAERFYAVLEPATAAGQLPGHVAARVCMQRGGRIIRYYTTKLAFLCQNWPKTDLLLQELRSIFDHQIVIFLSRIRKIINSLLAMFE